MPRVIKTQEAAIAALREFGGSDVSVSVTRRMYEVVSPGNRYQSEEWGGWISIGNPELAKASVHDAKTANDLVRQLIAGAQADRKKRLERARLGHREKGIEGAPTRRIERAPVLCLEHKQ